MPDLEYLCQRINMPAEAAAKIISIEKECNYSGLHNMMEQLQNPSSWEKGLEELKQAFPEDKDGWKILTCMLVTGLSTYELYRDKGITEDIFYDTFGCFSRFVKEHMISYGRYGFDREWWTTRQLSMKLFRIGELEYELCTKDGQPVISIHIPSDSSMTKEKCRDSYRNSTEFLRRFYPDFAYQYFYCHSWLLSPNLKDVMDTNSKILQFQQAFDITEFEEEAKDYLEWVYKNPKLTIDEVPQDTSLQRKMKVYLLQGGKIGAACGVLKEKAFE